MKENVTRRNFIATASIAALATGIAHGAEESPKDRLKILGVACSPRKGMTTAKAVQIALDAAKAVHSRIEVELLDLGGLNIAGWSSKPPQDDFAAILPKLQDPALGALIIGSPSYYRGISSLCKAFIERCSPLREPKMLLANKPVGAIAVGGSRNGGHEMVIQQIHAAMMCFGMVPVGGPIPGSLGGTVQSSRDEISADDYGVDTARKLGIRLAEIALLLARK